MKVILIAIIKYNKVRSVFEVELVNLSSIEIAFSAVFRGVVSLHSITHCKRSIAVLYLDSDVCLHIFDCNDTPSDIIGHCGTILSENTLRPVCTLNMIYSGKRHGIINMCRVATAETAAAIQIGN